VRTWIYRIALNEALGTLRRRREVPLPDPDDVSTSGRADDSVGLSVRLALGRVAPDHRALLVLRYWEGLSTDEIAAVLHLAPGAVRMRLLRARREFRRCYEDET
jgi:RNA polymerase sigma-70 factor (ECF subfamily)